MPNTIAKEREEDEHRVLTSRCQAVCDLLVRHDPFHETFLLHLPESAGEDARRQPRIVAQDLPKPRQLQERHVPQDEQRPFAPEPFDALADRIRLVRQERVDLAFTLPGISPPSHHYPSGPYQAYILSNGYHFARPRAYDGTEEDPNGIRRGRLDGFLRVFEHRSSRDPEFLGEGFRLALRVREVPHGRLPLVPNAGGGQGGVRPAQAKEIPGSTSYVRVDDLDAARKKVERAGGQIVLPRVDVPGMGSFFWFRAPGGPILAAWQDAPALPTERD